MLDVDSFDLPITVSGSLAGFFVIRYSIAYCCWIQFLSKKRPVHDFMTLLGSLAGSFFKLRHVYRFHRCPASETVLIKKSVYSLTG